MSVSLVYIYEMWCLIDSFNLVKVKKQTKHETDLFAYIHFSFYICMYLHCTCHAFLFDFLNMVNWFRLVCFDGILYKRCGL